MTTQEIKDIFEVDIFDKTRKQHIVLLKVFYIKNNKHKKLRELAKDLKLSIGAVGHFRKILSDYEQIEGYKTMGLAFKTKSKAIFDIAIKEITRDKRSDGMSGKRKMFKTIVKMKKPDIFVSFNGGTKRVSEAMKNAGIKNHPLLNKKIKEYTQKDLNELIKIENETNFSKSNGTMAMR